MWTIVKYTEEGDIYEVVDGVIYQDREDAESAYNDLMFDSDDVTGDEWFSICPIDVAIFS